MTGSQFGNCNNAAIEQKKITFHGGMEREREGAGEGFYIFTVKRGTMHVIDCFILRIILHYTPFQESYGKINILKRNFKKLYVLSQWFFAAVQFKFYKRFFQVLY